MPPARFVPVRVSARLTTPPVTFSATTCVEFRNWITPPLLRSTTVTTDVFCGPSSPLGTPLTVGWPSASVDDRLPSRIVLAAAVIMNVLLVAAGGNVRVPELGVKSVGGGELTIHGTRTVVVVPPVPPVRVTVSVRAAPSVTLEA